MIGYDGLTEQILREAEALHAMLSGTGLFVLLVVVGAGVLAYRGLSRLIVAVGRSGYGLQRRLAVLRVLLTGLIVFWGSSVVIRQSLQRVPLLTIALVALFLGGGLLGFAQRLQRALGGLLLVLRGRVREGDRLTVGGISGLVRHAGLLRIQLQRADGATVYLPASTLDAEALVISTPSRAQPVELRLPQGEALDAERRERILVLATLCPFRIPSTELSVALDENGRGVVRLQAWSASAADEAEAWLRRSLAAAR